jgi:glycosyltransferase involved in cell wall biosynthesis
LSVVPYGVDLSRFDPQRVAAQRMIQLAQNWRLPDDKPIIMLPGRYVPQKGHALLLEALTEVKDVELRCLMVGPSSDGGAYRDQLDKLVTMMGLEERVLLADECRDMPAALMLADLVAAPYLTPSTYNRVVIEAQALGRPLVVSDYPCARELVEGSSMAWLVPPNDAQALAWAIRDALALPSEERQARTTQVIENLQRRSDRDWMRRRVLGMYWDLSGKPGTPF